MLKLNLQLFASKKVLVPQRTDATAKRNVSALSVLTAKPLLAEASWFANAERKFILVRTWASAKTTLCLLKWTAL